jgi:PTH1 family peptidyl-tRNA hydrolase
MESSGPKVILIAGLGNPGREYRATRHNIGFMLIDHLASELKISMSKVQAKSLIGSGQVYGHRVILAKPQTFMNLSGQAIGSLAKYYKVEHNCLLIAHDDLDLPLGTLRLRPGGGSAGQRGVASVIETLSTQGFPRLRLGIGRPPGRMDPKDYVLQGFSAQDQEVLEVVLRRGIEAVHEFIEYDLDTAMNHFNGSVD